MSRTFGGDSVHHPLSMNMHHVASAQSFYHKQREEIERLKQGKMNTRVIIVDSELVSSAINSPDEAHVIQEIDFLNNEIVHGEANSRPMTQ